MTTKILIVEDNELNLDVLSRRLLRKGFEVITATEGEAGVKLAETEKPDIILMDLSLPILDGYAAVRKLKADPSTKSIPVIAITAHAMVGDREKAMDAGCDDYQGKPINFIVLLEKIDHLLNQTT